MNNNNIENSLKKINNKLNKLTICDKHNKKYTLENYINMLEGLITPEIINERKLSREKEAELRHIRRIRSQKRGGRKRNKSKRLKRSKRSKKSNRSLRSKRSKRSKRSRSRSRTRSKR